MKSYDVMRVHLGDKPYEEGDVREADPAKVSHLVKAGVLKERAEPQNKAKEPAANKAKKPASKKKAG